MEVCVRKMLVSFLLFFIGMLVVMASPVMADEVLIWDAQVSSSGAASVSPILKSGVTYRIVADEIWWYNYSANLAADAQYYTTNPFYYYWTNHIPAPGGHSFLQINGADVDWGPFSNGDTGHTYSIYYDGEGATLSFAIMDWVDGNYDNNDCYIRVRIYKCVTVGGYVVDSNPTGMIALQLIGSVVVALLITIPVVWRSRKAES